MEKREFTGEGGNCGNVALRKRIAEQAEVLRASCLPVDGWSKVPVICPTCSESVAFQKGGLKVMVDEAGKLNPIYHVAESYGVPCVRVIGSTKSNNASNVMYKSPDFGRNVHNALVRAQRMISNGHN